MKHGYVAYRSGKCHCPEVCRPEHNARRKEERARPSDHASQRVSRLRADGRELLVLLDEMPVIEALLKDGADTATVARRCGLTHYKATQVIKNVIRGGGFDSRLEFAVAVLREEISLVPSTSLRRDAAV